MVEINPDISQVLVHFKGWGQRFDEWVELADKRLKKATDDYPRYRGCVSRKVCPPMGVAGLDIFDFYIV